uniref:Uncharacterized protein n=1 Tax=viral metagenome TaxID=1070528 RepID=A0A6C0EHA5_9ZZZZ
MDNEMQKKDNNNKYKNEFIKMKRERRERKRTTKRAVTGEEVIFIFEKVLEKWPTIKIYNTIIQKNPNSGIDKKITETIATGNCKVYETELSKDRYEYYVFLREKVYENNKK